MRITRAFYAVVLSLLLSPLSALAADPPSVARNPATWTGGIAFLGAQPLGEFADSSGFGAGATGSATWWRGNSPLGLRFEVGGVIYGSQTIRETARTGWGGYPYETSADNWFATLQAGPELCARSGAVRPYIFATLGASYFATSWETADDMGRPVTSAITYDSWTFAARGGAGILVPLGRSTQFDLGVRYLYNSEVDYFAEGDTVVIGDEEFPTLGRPRQSSVQALEFVAGIRFDF